MEELEEELMYLKAIAAGAKACSFGKAVFVLFRPQGANKELSIYLKICMMKSDRNMILMGCKSIKELE